MPNRDATPNDISRDSRINEVLGEVARRRAVGEEVLARDVTEQYPDLMPELGEKLRALSRVDAAQERAGESARGESEDAAVRETETELPKVETPGESLDAVREPAPAIPGYEILRELHRGGQGVVYQAIQKSTKRKVAVKLLLQGTYASPIAKKRFEREIELIGQLKHPNIINIFHAGVTPEGRQFCVMDYVRGVTLTRYVREKKLSLEGALKLFSAVCDGVQHAHQKGVIHRDLKPSNILVDSDGVPKVLDFGLAKQLAEPIDTLVTVTGQVIGTLPYMSPEQARGNPDEIDTRTDIYALGVILYEMLTGHFPYPVVGQMADVLKHIAETPPTPPTRVWKSDSGVTTRTKRRVRPGKCPIDDDVQTIVLKALSKEQDRRYQSAIELARDVQHYLAGKPIDAKRDSTWYVIRKSLRRYRVAAGVAAAFVLLLAGSTVALSILYQNQSRAREEAESAREAEAALRVQAERDFAIAHDALEYLEFPIPDSIPLSPGKLSDGGLEQIRADNRKDLKRLLDKVPLFRRHLDLGDDARQRSDLTAAKGHFREALALGERLAHIEPETLRHLQRFDAVYERLAELSEIQGLESEARTWTVALMNVRRRRAQRPDVGSGALLTYARLLLNCKQPDLRDPIAALQLAEKAAEMDCGKGFIFQVSRTEFRWVPGDNVYALRTLARAYHMTGNDTKALETLNQVLSVFPPGDWPLRRELESDLAEFRGSIESGGD